MWEYLIEVLSEPTRALHDVAEKKLWKESLLLTLVIALLTGIVALAAVNTKVANMPDQATAHLIATLYSPGVFIPFTIGYSAFSWFIVGAIFYGFSKLLFKGAGTLAGMLASLGFARTPSLLSVPLTALALLFGRTTGSLVEFAAVMVASIWTLVLFVIAIRESQQLDTGQAVGVILSTVAAFFVAILAIIIILGFIQGIVTGAFGR